MEIEQIIPERRRVSLAELLSALAAAQPIRPFSGELMQLCESVSSALFHDPEAKAYAELQALAFRMRKAELVRLRAAFADLDSDQLAWQPRGIVFHVPPANVDTIFVYSWMLAALTGNVNVVRLSARTSPVVEILCRLLAKALDASSEPVRRATTIVRYGHEREITEALSAISDVRVIWGGDAAVSLIREFPLPPHARDLTFPDRRSLSALSAERYLALDGAGQERLADGFFNDAYWFDQMACSSPRLIVWCGPEEAVSKAIPVFADQLVRRVRSRGYSLPDAVRLGKLTFTCRAILEASVYGCYQTAEMTTLDVRTPEGLPADHCGGGLFYQARVEALGDIAKFLTRRDQTMTYFGFDAQELRALADHLRGTAVDRMVPIGQALMFNRFWDGYDLLREFTRVVYIEKSAGRDT